MYIILMHAYVYMSIPEFLKTYGRFGIRTRKMVSFVGKVLGFRSEKKPIMPANDLSCKTGNRSEIHWLGGGNYE